MYKKTIVFFLVFTIGLIGLPLTVFSADEASFVEDTTFSVNSVTFSIMAGSLADQVDIYSTYIDFTLSANSTIELRSYNRYLFTSSAANTDCSNGSYSKFTLPAYSTQTVVRVTPTSDVCPSPSGGGGGGSAPNNTPTPTPTPEPEPEPEPETQPSESGSTTMAVPEDYDLKEGDLIRAVGDFDIFIISQHGYKRLFLNPTIFEMYGHLGSWDDVKTVAPSTRDAFKTSSHYRYVGEDKVYHLNITGGDTAQLRWLNMTGEAFMNQGGTAEGVFVINESEFNWYEQGEDKTSL